MSDPAESSPRKWLWAALLLTAFKLWLTRGQHVFAIGPAAHDDRLFLQLAEHLLNGEWLGPYHQMTLAKGPFYSMWVALVFTLGVPLFLAQHLLYAGACAAVVAACRPGLRSHAGCFALYALLLWNPMSFDASSLGRVLRQHVYSPQVLLIFAAYAGLYFRRSADRRALLPWAALLGLSTAAFWLTREESVWLMPSMLLLTGAVLYGAWRNSPQACKRMLRALGVAAGCAVAPVMIVSALNYHYYRWFGTVETRASAFQDAYGAMVRVQIGPDIPFVPVTREARQAMYAVSPAFAELQPHLEGRIGMGWAEASSGVTGQPAGSLQIGGGWLVWALRDAVVAAGHGEHAGEAMAFYRRMADEINAACATGQLPAGPPRSGFMPVWREGQWAQVARTLLAFADYTVSFRGFSALAPQSVGDTDTLTLFRDLTRERLSPSADAITLATPLQDARHAERAAWLHRIGKILRRVLLGLFVLAQIIAGVRVVQLARRRSWSFPLTLAAAAWGGGLAYLLIQAVIQVTSFNVMVISSFAPVYPLILLFMGTVFWDASMPAAAWLRNRRSRVRTQQEPPAPPEAPPRAGGRWLVVIVGLAALTPFLIWRKQFAELYWFGDDYFLVDQIAEMGLWNWMWLAFAENFVPLFKLLWGGSLLLFNGSYQALLTQLWITHVLNTICLGWLLLRAGFPWIAIVATQIVFGLSVANIETLGWSVQWSAILATTFLLLALLWHERHADAPPGWNWRVHGPLVLLAAASACSFSRGVLTGAVIALALLLPAVIQQQGGEWRRRWLPAFLCLLPALGVAVMIMLLSRGNHRDMSGHWAEALEFGLGFFLLNPGHLLFGTDPASPGPLLLVAAGKLAIVTAGLWIARGRVRVLLILLLAYDLGNAALLGIGRYHTGFISSMASRYYYSSLLATLPFAGLLLAAWIERIRVGVRWKIPAAILLLALLSWHVLRGWPGEVHHFVEWRGTGLRQLMAAPTTTDPKAVVPALEFMHVERAKALIRAYDLH